MPSETQIQNRRDWQEIMEICGWRLCCSCKEKKPIQLHHTEPRKEGQPAFNFYRPVSVNGLYELIVLCKPYCRSCHKRTHSGYKLEREIDTTPELDGILHWV